MKVLVTYGTWAGSTEGIAAWIAEGLRQTGAEVTMVPADSAPGPDGFDAVVIGSAIRAGMWNKMAKRYVKKNADALAEMPTAFFSVGLTVTEDEEDAYDKSRGFTEKMLEGVPDISAADIGVFAGAFDPEKLGGIVGFAMRHAEDIPVGDFRDEDEVTEWARGLPPKLEA
jgi:menaquinone-dependent protoporphyrinogen oxidase